MPTGTRVDGRDGRWWINPDPQAVVQATIDRGVDICIDENHGIDVGWGPGSGQAKGWCRNLSVDADGSTWADVEWTNEGRRLVESRAYRYISPVFNFSESDKTILALVGAALTNRPNLRIPAINSESIPDGQAAGIKEDISMKKICAALGLAETASEDEAVTAINSLKEKKATNAQAGGVDLSLYAPRADLAQMESRATNAERALSDLKAANLKKRAEAAVDAAVKDRKIAPASRDAYLAMCSSEEGIKQFETIAKATASIIPADTEVPKSPPPASETALNAEELDQAKKMGYTPEEWKKVKEASK